MHILNCRIIFKGLKDSSKIALTFDDGPHDKFTPMILDILDNRNIKASFFLTGNNITQNKKNAIEIFSRGHLICNHTYSHPNLFFLNKRRTQKEVTATKDIIEDMTGKPNKYLRPPYGIITPSLLSVCRKEKMSIVFWSLNSFDYREKTSDWIVNRIENKIKPGSVILFHECHFGKKERDYSNTVKALNIILDHVLSQNLSPVTVDKIGKVRIN